MKIEQRVMLTFVFVFTLLAGGAFGQEPSASPAPSAPATGKRPIIIIPGLTGTELVNRRTGEKVWFRARRAKDDDIRLPIGPVLVRNRDDLVPGDIIRSIQLIKFLPETEIYERLVDSLQKQGGYREAKWGTATRRDAADTFFVFAYDWRLDNAENARALVRKIVALKRQMGRADLKFNVVAHSMGGLIARYAAMYGDRDIPPAGSRPTWAGARHFDNIFLVGTPNEGSITALNAILNGFSYIGGGLNLPFIQNINRFDVFTIPSIFQLLPHEGSLAAYDNELKPLTINIYDPAEWEKYGWSIWQDSNFKKRFSAVEQRNARPYFRAVLARARLFQAALNANSSEKVPVAFHIVGADCKDTVSGVLVLKNEKDGKWETRFKPTALTRASGEKITEEEVRAILVGVGDSVVTKRSLSAASLSSAGRKFALPIVTELYQCEAHNKLVTNTDIQARLLSLLSPILAN